ncbi:hypothetical protein [Bacillus chungangensis]|uniref:Uncharacterized protein n=1 Tax=Bacillus chungangensis TaxID=587633 RepID=A0ABT9WN05_9BACI|nr:hypothetical protein [Bacillus chungangensis]MDQ0174673.1 hypothetical protein [Bacillus chungangensis]
MKALMDELFEAMILKFCLATFIKMFPFKKAAKKNVLFFFSCFTFKGLSDSPNIQQKPIMAAK